MMSQPDGSNRTGILDFEKFLQKTAQERMISDAETRLRREQKEAEQRLNATCQRIENKLDDFIIETRTANKRLEDKIERLDDKFDAYKKWNIGILVTLVLGALALIGLVYFG